MSPRAPLRVCVVTGTRAEYGLLRPVMRRIAASPRLELQTVVTGMHLAPQYGETWRAIDADGFAIDERVEMLLAGDTPVAVTKSLGLGTIAFADAFARLRPDLVMVLGDRFELLAAAQAALIARIPIAHISGGDRTEGAMDEAIRHAITKMSHLHFVTNAAAARRVRQLGEDPARVVHSGNPGLDDLARFEPLPRAEAERRLGLRLGAPSLLVTFHPVTLDEAPAALPFEELLAALDRFPEAALVFTYPNADTFGQAIVARLETYVAARVNAVAHRSLGQTLYWTAMHYCDAVVGNSSSGLLEAPTLKKPSVNIGDRQRGRVRAASTLDCPPQRDAIADAIARALRLDCSGIVNPYGNGDAAGAIVAALEALDDPRALVKKTFHDLETAP